MLGLSLSSYACGSRNADDAATGNSAIVSSDRSRLLRITRHFSLSTYPTQVLHEIRGDDPRSRAFIDSLWIRYESAFPEGKWINVGPDASFTQIELVRGDEKIVAASWHSTGKPNRNIIATAIGLESLDGRNREAVLASQPEDYRRGREAFDAIVSEADQFD